MDPYKQLGVIYNQDDDTVQRLVTFPCTTTEHHNSLPNQPIFTHDIPLNSSHKTSLRLFKPSQPPLHTKLPLIIFIHGGGFILASPFINLFHDFCTSMSSSLGVVVLSLDYRLAPESRLPAAYEDAVEALTWVRDEAENNMLLKDIVDVSNCYLMGDSAGGNIVYHAGLRAVGMSLQPLVIKGYIFIQPFFGGMKRTESEMRLAEDKILSLAGCDHLWELALPKGSDRHEYCDPMVGGSSNDKIGLLQRCFLIGRGGDILLDRQKEFMKMLEGKGVEVESWFEEEGCHGVFLFEPEKALHLFAVIRDFIHRPIPIAPL